MATYIPPYGESGDPLSITIYDTGDVESWRIAASEPCFGCRYLTYLKHRIKCRLYRHALFSGTSYLLSMSYVDYERYPNCTYHDLYIDPYHPPETLDDLRMEEIPL